MIILLDGFASVSITTVFLHILQNFEYTYTNFGYKDGWAKNIDTT